MTSISAIILLVLLLGGIFLILHGQQKNRRTAPNSELVLEYRTDLPVDVCMDLLRTKQEDDLFEYTCVRGTDGTFTLRFTLHRPTQQPLGTVYNLRLDSGRQTVVTLMFQQEAFGYGEPVFATTLLDDFIQAKLSATRNLSI